MAGRYRNSAAARLQLDWPAEEAADDDDDDNDEQPASNGILRGYIQNRADPDDSVDVDFNKSGSADAAESGPGRRNAGPAEYGGLLSAAADDDNEAEPTKTAAAEQTAGRQGDRRLLLLFRGRAVAADRSAACSARFRLLGNFY
jgi:hypothetical protein